MGSRPVGITLGSITLGSITLGRITLGRITLGRITLGVITPDGTRASGIMAWAWALARTPAGK